MKKADETENETSGKTREFNVMVCRYGFATIAAETEREALEKVNTMQLSDFDWSSGITSDDASIVDENE